MRKTDKKFVFIDNEDYYLVDTNKYTKVVTWDKKKSKAWRIEYLNVAYQAMEYLFEEYDVKAALIDIDTGKVYANSTNIDSWDEMPYYISWINPKTQEHDCLFMPSKRSRDLLTKIIKAAWQRYLCKITYQKVGSKRVVSRIIRPYSYDKNRYILYVTEVNHKSDEIRSIRVDRIRSVQVLKSKYKPKFEVIL